MLCIFSRLVILRAFFSSFPFLFSCNFTEINLPSSFLCLLVLLVLVLRAMVIILSYFIACFLHVDVPWWKMWPASGVIWGCIFIYLYFSPKSFPAKQVDSFWWTFCLLCYFLQDINIKIYKMKHLCVFFSLFCCLFAIKVKARKWWLYPSFAFFVS